MAIEVFHYSEKMASQIVGNLYEKNLLVPFFGAGLTKGSQSKRGSVPDAARMIETIKKIALANKEKEDEKEDIESINDLKTAYQILLDTDYVNATNRGNFLDNSFSQVKIEPEKSIFLKKKWRRIYTFNIDDAIENVRRDFQVICPFKEVSVEYVRGHNCIMKIHGDINEYKKYNNTSIIFSWLEYAKSIEDNKAMLNILESDARDRSFIFIGCSLDKEVDLMLVAAKHKFEKSIFIQKGKPSLSSKKT